MVVAPVFAQSPSGWLEQTSRLDWNQTIGNVRRSIQRRELKIFSEIDHQIGAIEKGNALRPTYLFIFGNPKVGSVVMECDQKMGIELPLKILVWQEEDEKIKIGCYDPLLWADKHDLESCRPVLEKMKSILQAISSEASQ